MFSVSFYPSGYLPPKMDQFSMVMTMNVSRGYWMIKQWNVTYAATVTIGGAEQKVNGTNVGIDTHNDLIYGTLRKLAQDYCMARPRLLKW